MKFKKHIYIYIIQNTRAYCAIHGHYHGLIVYQLHGYSNTRTLLGEKKITAQPAADKKYLNSSAISSVLVAFHKENVASL